MTADYSAVPADTIGSADSDIDTAEVFPDLATTMIDNVQPKDFLIENPGFESSPLAIGAVAGTRMVYQHPIRYTGKEKQRSVIRYWAEKGLIRASWFDDDLNTERYETFTVKTILERLQAINDMVKNSRASDPNYLPGEMDKLQTFVDEMVELVRLCREQGTPDNPDTLKAIKAAKPGRILVP